MIVVAFIGILMMIVALALSIAFMSMFLTALAGVGPVIVGALGAVAGLFSRIGGGRGSRTPRYKPRFA